MNAEFIKDSQCTIETPVINGQPKKNVYGRGYIHTPGIPSKQVSEYEKSHYLPELLPLEDYDIIIVLYSGGKDCTAAYEVLREKGVPKDKIRLWHHDIDGGHPTRRMDWPVTKAYVEAFAEAEGVKLLKSWRMNGFWGEVYRMGASWPVQYEGDDREIHTCTLTKAQQRSQELREGILSDAKANELEGYGCRNKFPAKSADLSTRWCSAYLKIMIGDVLLRQIDKLEELEGIGKRHKFPAKGKPSVGRWCSNSLKVSLQSSITAELEETKENVKILVVSGERRGESAGRAKYNEMEIHRTNATKRANRLVHVWRPVIDYHEGDVWEVMKRHNIRPHPCYITGWNRCSCMMCIFSLPRHWAGLRELFPNDVAAVQEDERRLGFTIDNKLSLEDYIGDAKSCVCRDDPEAIRQLITGNYDKSCIYTKPGEWVYPAGAFKGSEGGPC